MLQFQAHLNIPTRASSPSNLSQQYMSKLSRAFKRMASPATSEGWLTTRDHQRLYTKTWSAAASPARARIAVIHGFSDHSNNYEPLFPTLAQRGITVHAFDQRGWGRSIHEPKQKGLTGPTKTVMEDITDFLRSLPPAEANEPLFLVGHSMGGAEVLVYAAIGPKDVLSTIRGFMVISPFIALHPSARPWKSTVVLGRLAGRMLPHRQMVNRLDATKLCRDPDVCQAYIADPLCHDTGTLEGLAGMLDSTLR